jgi:hypothetical protein
MTISTNKLQSRLAVRNYLDDPADATVARNIAWVPMDELLMVLCTLIAGTGVLTFKIFAATDAAGANATEVKAHSNPTPADAPGDQLVLEVSAEEVRQALPGATHVSVQMDNDAAGDVNLLTYVRSGQRFGGANLTADAIAP